MLNRIRLRGFKSFSNQTSLELSAGVNVIVGPNGSGKSNLAEAVVWALGEQRAGRLRAGGMGEVLHAGGTGAQAQIAEVELVLEAPSAEDDSAELSVSRRLTRAGDTQYATNGQACRLLDVQDALAARGLGPDALAIVRQGQVDALVVSKPHERRAMVEEAAGVAASKRRRRRAERKLARVAESVARARDLEQEFATHDRRLARQAGAAERAARLDRELAAARRALLERRLESTRAEQERIADERERLRGALAGAQTARDEAVRAVRGLEQERERAAERVREAERFAMQVRAEAERLSGRAELAHERLGEERERAERLGRVRAEAAERLDEIRATASEAERALHEAQRAIEGAEVEAREREVAAEAARRRSDELRDAAAARTRSLAELVQEQEELALRGARAREVIAATEQRLEASGAGDEVARAERREEIAAGRAARWRERLGRAVGALQDARARLAAAEDRRRAAQARLRALPDHSDPRPSALSAGLTVRPGLERAVAAALGAAADAEPVPDAGAGVAAVEGGAPAAVTPAPTRSWPEPGVTATPLLEAVESCPEPQRPHVERLLAGAWLVEDLAAVPSGAEGLFVTAAGHAYRPSTGVLSAPGAELAARAERERTERELEAAADQVERESAIQAGFERDHGAAARRARAADRSADRAARALAAARARIAADDERRARDSGALAQAERDLAEGDARRVELRARRDELQRLQAESTQEVEAVRRDADRAQAEWRAAQTTLADAATAAAAARARAAEFAAQLAATEAAAATPVPGLSEDPLAVRAAEALARAAAAIAPLTEAARGRAADRAQDGTRVERDLAAARERRDRADEAFQQASERLQEAHVSHAVAEERAAEATRALEEGPPPVEGDPVELPDDLEELAAHVDALEHRRAGIGMVNPLAAEEREELQERKQELEEQIADLEDASAALMERMGQLDAAISEGYEEVFSTLSSRFSEVAEMLFPGGTGRLREMRDEDGEPGIEIEVVPAGKKARSLGLLSGGEKSLVALAFCLSLAMVRPAPFYLLDEVEAALDDVNLRRFLGVVRKLAGETQFILITHQQPTVEIADTLFGVTMGSGGASQILSRKLARTVEGPAKPYVRRTLQAISGGRA